jgi:hypothetical protein
LFIKGNAYFSGKNSANQQPPKCFRIARFSPKIHEIPLAVEALTAPIGWRAIY